jgi:hypothetical protein
MTVSEQIQKIDDAHINGRDAPIPDLVEVGWR